MDKINAAVNNLIEAILNSEEYRAYREELEKVKLLPTLKEQIDEFRKRNYLLQNSEDFAFDKLEEFEKEFQKFRENPLVDAFLASELAFCRMMQNIEATITEALHFE